MKVLTVLFLVMAVLGGCMNLEAPPPAFGMFCDTCGTETRWGFGEYYFYCTESGTIWTPLEEAGYDAP